MAFKDIYDCAPRDITERELARFIWEYQQFSIDRLLEDRVKDRARIDELEQWVSAIADDHPQIPDWIQQSARSLLAQGGA